MPIDLSIVVDVSGNPDRPFATPPAMAKVAAQVDEQARKATALLRAGDRVRLFAIDTYVQQIWPLQPAATTPPVRRLHFDGHASLYNTLTTLLLQPVEPTRRHVIVLATRGLDSSSSISAAGVRAIAERSDAQMHLVMREVEADAEVTVRCFQCENMDLCQPTTRFCRCRGAGCSTRFRSPRRLPPPRILFPDGQQLKAAAIATGGDLYMGEVLSDPTLFGTFFEGVRQLPPELRAPLSTHGVEREGLASADRHRTARQIAEGPGAQRLRDRRAAGAGEAARADHRIDAAADAARADLGVRARRLRSGDAEPSAGCSIRTRLIADFDRGGNPWPGSPRREALFALETRRGGPVLRHVRGEDRRSSRCSSFGRLVRHPLGPDEFERAWSSRKSRCCRR